MPQGSVYGPLLFRIYVNDISDRLRSLTKLFTDESTLFYSASSIPDIEGIINCDLRIFCNWAARWLIKLTVAKVFKLNYKYTCPRLVFENTPTECVDNHKHLGLTLSNEWTNGIATLTILPRVNLK